MYAQVFGPTYGLETVSLRYFNVFGPRRDPTSQYSGALSRFSLALLEGARPVVFGDGEQSQDFTYIDNVVDATLRACEADGASGMVFNVGTRARITLNQVLSVFEEITGRPVRVKYEPSAGDILHSQADINLARKVLGYEPHVNFGAGLRNTWDWYRKSYTRSLASCATSTST